MRPILTALVAAALILTPSAAHAGKPANDGYTITLNPTPGLPIEDTAADWSKNTGVNVQVAPCTGPNCITFSIVDAPCNIAFGNVAGCAYRLADGGCHVEVGTYAYNRDGLRSYTTKHETGHCIWSITGRAHISHHLEGDRALMSARVDPGVRRASLTSEDRTYTRG